MFAVIGRRPLFRGPGRSAGRWSDPLVGRDALYGVILGVLFCDLYGIRYHLEARFGAPPGLLSTDYLGNARLAIGAWFGQIPASIVTTSSCSCCFSYAAYYCGNLG